jgi:hypothetical protein
LFRVILAKAGIQKGYCTFLDGSKKGRTKRKVFVRSHCIIVAIQHISQEWLPTSAHQRADSAEFELYDERFEDSEDNEMDIYIPITDWWDR